MFFDEVDDRMIFPCVNLGCGSVFVSDSNWINLDGSALIYGSEKKQPKTAIYCRKVSRVA